MTASDRQISLSVLRDVERRDVGDLIIAGLRERYGVAFDATLNPDAYDLPNSYPGSLTVVARLRGDVVATGTLAARPGGVGEIVRMSTAAHTRRIGLAGQVLDHLIDEARKRDCRELRVSTTSTWTSARALYASRGFEEIGLFQDTDETDVRCVLPLSGSGPVRSFEIVPGAPGSTVLLHVPHASRVIPADVRSGIGLSDADLDRELTAITDADTDVLAERVADLCGVRPWVFVNRLSRLVVDPERFPDETEEMNAVGMGVVYEATTQRGVLRQPSPADRRNLVQTYFEPYAAALAELVTKRLASAGRVTIVDVHSYPASALPYELHGNGPRPEVCLGTDDFHTPELLLDRARSALAAVTGDVTLDSPFSGCYVPLDRYRRDSAVEAIMLEIRRDLLASRPDDLASAIARLVETL